MKHFSWGIQSTDGSRERESFNPWESLTFNDSTISIGLTEFKCTESIFSQVVTAKKQPYMVLRQEYSFVISTPLRSKCHIYSPDAIWPFNYFAWKLSFFTCPSWDTFSQENYLAVLCVRLARAKNSLSFSRTEESCSVDVCRFCEGLGQGTTPDLKNRLGVYGKSFISKEGREGLDCQGTGCRFRNLRS